MGGTIYVGLQRLGGGGGGGYYRWQCYVWGGGIIQ